MEDPTPPRRCWFRFRLSTWFVLVAILAWALATPVWLLETKGGIVIPGFFAYTDRTPDSRSGVLVEATYGLNPNLKFPPLALCAFIAWKRFRVSQERRRERANAAGPSLTPLD